MAKKSDYHHNRLDVLPAHKSFNYLTIISSVIGLINDMLYTIFYYYVVEVHFCFNNDVNYSHKSHLEVIIISFINLKKMLKLNYKVCCCT